MAVGSSPFVPECALSVDSSRKASLLLNKHGSGANGSQSTENTDEQTLIEKMHNFMKSSGSLSPETTLEQAYPYLKQLITVDSARRQHLDSIETHAVEFAAPQSANEGPAMWTTNRENAETAKQGTKNTGVDKDEEIEDHAFPIQISPNRIENAVEIKHTIE